MDKLEKNEKSATTGYLAVPRKRRGNRRASGGSSVGGAEPRLAGLTPVPSQETVADTSRDAWMKEQKPPHYGS